MVPESLEPLSWNCEVLVDVVLNCRGDPQLFAS